MKDSHDVNALISSIYDSVLDPTQWEKALDHVADFFGAQGVMVLDEFRIGEHGSTIVNFLNSASYSETDFNDLYFHDFGRFEARSHKALIGDEKRVEFILNLNVEAQTMLHPTEDYYDKNDPDYEGSLAFCRKMGIGYRAGTALNYDTRKIDRMGFSFKEPIDPYSDEYREKGRLIFPHLSKALRLSRSIGMAPDGSLSIQKYDNEDIGVCILSPHFIPIYSNNEYKRINDFYGLFRVNNRGEIMPSYKDLKAYFHGFFDGKTKHGRFGGQPRKESLLLRFNEKNTSIFVEVSPLRFHEDVGIFPEGSLLIQLLDVKSVAPQNVKSLSQFFPLSPTEQEIASLILQGYSNVEIAEMRGRAPDTIKSQIKAIYNKTYTNGRAELSQLARSLELSFSSRFFKP